MHSTTISSIENVCRTCMGKYGHDSSTESQIGKTVSIFKEQESSENNTITLMELLLLTTPQLNIEKDDMLPKILCENCVDKLVKANEFQQMCIRIEQRLREIIDEQKPTIDENNTDPLYDGVVKQAKNELSDIFETEVDEPIIDHSDDDIFKYVPSSSDDYSYVPTSSDDSEWESKFNISKSKNLGGNNISNLEDKEVDNNSKNTSNQNDAEKYEYECDECGNRLKTSKSLKRHKLIHLRSQVKEGEPDNLGENLPIKDNKTYLNTYKSQEIYEKSSYQFECDECGRRIKTRKSLSRHKKIHLREPVVKKKVKTKIKTKTINECEYCQKVFQKPSLLQDHIRIHTGELPYLCSECGKSFRKASVLKQHLLRHGTDKPHVCPDCPKSFSTISDLASHKQVHTKTKPHVCDVCGASFVKAFYLKQHKMYHTGEKNHKCDHCDRRFVTGYQCRRHMRTHTGEKPHKCKYCDRAYTQSNELMKHLRIHLGDSVYNCSLCPQGFPLHAELRQHFNTHKNDDEATKLRNLQALEEKELRLEIKFGLVDGT